MEAATADFGVVPIENSTEGTVNHTLDRFLTSPLKICGEVELRIHHHLMGNMSSLGRIERVCSHPQSLAQCRAWLEEHLPSVEQVPVSSNAEGARRARDEKGTAAIAGETAAEVYGLKVLAAEIEDRADNTTRFLVLGRKLFAPSGEDRTTLLVSVGHTDAPGALYRLLEPLAQPPRQHDAHRVAAVAPAQVGLRVLHRSRRPCRGAARGQGARGAEEARLAVPRARLLSAGGAVSQRLTAARRLSRGRRAVRSRASSRVPGRQVDLAPRADARRHRRGRHATSAAFSPARTASRRCARCRRSGCASSGPAPTEVRRARRRARTACTPPPRALDMGNAGTAMRLFMGLLARAALRFAR